MIHKENARQISALLIAKGVVPKGQIRELFLDEELRRAVEESLSAVGLELATHIYSGYVAVKVAREMEPTVFSNDKDGFFATNEPISRAGLALLAVIWAKIILPKRQMQIERRGGGSDSQESLWIRPKPIPKADDMVSLDEKALLADFSEKVGGKMAFYRGIGELARANFIIKREKRIYEGPLLDTVIDYAILAPRIINGALGEMLGMGNNDEAPDTDSSYAEDGGNDVPV